MVTCLVDPGPQRESMAYSPQTGSMVRHCILKGLPCKEAQKHLIVQGYKWARDIRKVRKESSSSSVTCQAEPRPWVLIALAMTLEYLSSLAQDTIVCLQIKGWSRAAVLR